MSHRSRYNIISMSSSKTSPPITFTGDSLLYNEEFEEDIEKFMEHLERDDQLPDWLTHHSSFKQTGKQGVLGLLTKRKTGQTYVYKMSQYLNFMVRQEHAVMEGLNHIRDICPHFCKTYGSFRVKVTEDFRYSANPFLINRNKKAIDTEVLLMEHIDDARKLYRYIKNDSIPPEVIFSLVKQTLIATIIAGQHCRFSHYDLHSNNVMIKKCPANSVFLYVLDDSHSYLVPTYGYYPVIIDFGFSFNSNSDKKPMYGPLAHTDVGFVPAYYDQHTDAKLFLTSVSHEMRRYKKSEASSLFRNLVVGIYHNVHVDLTCGWDTREDSSISDRLLDKMQPAFQRSRFFNKHGHHIVDLLQAMVDLPLHSRYTTDDIAEMAEILVEEFAKVEREIGSDFYQMYVLRCCIQAGIRHKADYINKDTREKAVIAFRRDILEGIDSIARYCNPKIEWEKLLCCLLCLSKCIENECYDRLKRLILSKRNDYNRMALRNTTEIVEALEANLPSHFLFDKETTVYVWDSVERKSYKRKVPEAIIETLNRAHPFERGVILSERLSRM